MGEGEKLTLVEFEDWVTEEERERICEAIEGIIGVKLVAEGEVISDEKWLEDMAIEVTG